MQHQTAPLFDHCNYFLTTQKAAFYCPGHKGGRTLPADFTSRLAELDLNNLAETDTLHCPSGPILEAEALLADAYGAVESFMLVGGSTAGNTASLLATCGPGDQILVQRNAHKSTIAGIVLAGAQPIWLTPQRDPVFGIYHGISVAQLEAAFQAHPQAVAAMVLNPTYYGAVADLRALREVCARYDKLLLTDEAHGPHFHFHPGLPLAAEDAGADLVVQSTHKILSGLSQAAVLHKVTNRVPTSRIRKALQLIQTTSPSFPVMISIDLARRQMVLEGEARWGQLIAWAQAARQELTSISGVRVLGPQDLTGPGTGLFDLDITKLVIDVRQLGLSGSTFLQKLNQRGVKPELSGPTYVLAILTVGTVEEDLVQLCQAVREIAAEHSSGEVAAAELLTAELYHLPEQAMLPRDGFFSPQEWVPLEAAADRVCAEIVTPYPPGIPVLMPGECISSNILQGLLAIRASRFPVSASDPQLHQLLVVAQ